MAALYGTVSHLDFVVLGVCPLPSLLVSSVGVRPPVAPRCELLAERSLAGRSPSWAACQRRLGTADTVQGMARVRSGQAAA